MKTLALGILIFSFCFKNLQAQSDDNSMSGFALSVNPLGFVQFGPSLNAEFGLTDNMVLNTHLRFPSLGLLSYVVVDHEDGLDEFSGAALGGGLLYFFGQKKNKPYVGALLGYQITNAVYAKGQSYEWSEENSTVIVMANGGYRFRFGSGFFINTGAYLGVASTAWITDESFPYEDESGSELTPFGMLEFTLGFEF